MTAEYRLAIVGSGPSGLYAARAASKVAEFRHIDVIDALPAPYGLIRYGVAPDHPDTKRVMRVFDRMFDSGRVGFLGNVTVGVDLSHELLLGHYDFVLYAIGMSGPKRAEVPGADLPGSVSAAEFVSWYSGHPESNAPISLDKVTSAVVIGGGNVALDVVRLLTCSPELLRVTDMPDGVLQDFVHSRVRDVHLLVRRGPEHAQFSPGVLKELGGPEGGRIEVVPDGVDTFPVDSESLSAAGRENVELLTRWSGERQSSGDRSVKLHFWTEPRQIHGRTTVTGAQVVRQQPGAPVHVADIPAQLVVHCVGFSGNDHSWLPVDASMGTVPHDAGRVLLADGCRMERVYVAGWCKRGPRGVVATNRVDAEETIATVVEDSGRCTTLTSPPALVDTLRSAGVAVVTWAGWRAIELEERLQGRRRGADTVKLKRRDRLVEAANAATVSYRPGLHR